jgi:hypothetical protein
MCVQSVELNLKKLDLHKRPRGNLSNRRCFRLLAHYDSTTHIRLLLVQFVQTCNIIAIYKCNGRARVHITDII